MSAFGAIAARGYVRIGTAWLLAAVLWAGSAAAEPTAAERQQLAPSGTLRAAINFGNSVLAQRDPATGAPRGVSAALATELGRQLGVPVAFVTYNEAGLVAAAADKGAWDVAFLAIDPVRGATIDYTAPYVLIEGIYAVPAGSDLDSPAAVDAPGKRVIVALHSAYDLFLTRALKHATLVRFEDGAKAEAGFLAGDGDVIAGVKQPLMAFVAAHPGIRLLPGRFMSIEQAVALPKGREAGLAYASAFVAAAKATGFVRRALDASGQQEAEVAPP